jgi:glycosyl transferase family 25
MFKDFEIPENLYQRFSAVNGKKDLETLKNDVSQFGLYSLRNKKRSSNFQLGSPGALGCYMSHVRVWEMIVQNNWDGCFVLEDDVYLRGKFTPENLKAVKDRSIGYDIDCIKLYSSDIFDNFQNANFTTSIYDYPSSSSSIGDSSLSVYDVVDPETSTVGYFLSRKGAEKLLKKWNPMEVHVDFYVWLMRDSENISLESVFPYIVEPFGHVSDISHKSCPGCDTNDYITYNSRYDTNFTLLIFFVILITLSVYLLTSRKKK